jgi:hypothetical protein
MKYVKILGLAAVAAMALMAFGAGTASATKLCTEANTTACAKDEPVGTVIEATMKAGTSSILETTGGSTLDTCTGMDLTGKTENTNETGKPVGVTVTALTWTGCTFPTATTALGTLDISHIAGTDNGTLVATGTEVTINTGFFGACTYGAPATGLHLGTVTGGNPASITINALVPLTKNESGLCPAEARWTGSFTVTKPTPLYASHN